MLRTIIGGIRTLRSRTKLMIPLAIVLTFIFIGFCLPLLISFDPRSWGKFPRNLPPSFEHPLGTTSVGQDVFWLLTYSIRGSLIVGFIGSIVGLLIGAVLGLVAGHKGGAVDRAVIFLTDVFLTLPFLPLLILITILIKGAANLYIVGLAIAFLTWAWPVRNIRSIILSLREREFINVAIFSGMGTAKIITTQYLPHVLPWMSASIVGRMITAIGYEVILAVFGLIPLDEATIGTMIYWALEYQALMRGLWWWFFPPIISVIVFCIALYFLSSQIIEHLDPRLRHLTTM